MTDTTFGIPTALPDGATLARGEPRSADGHDLPDTEHDAVDEVAFQNGDDECFRAVLDRYGPLIRSVVWSFADSDDERDDLYQEVCVRMLEKRAYYRERDSMGGWIRTVARRVAQNWRDSRLARAAAKDGYTAATAPIQAARHITEDPSRLLKYKECLANVTRALDGIPDQQARAFRLVQIDGYSVREAARILKVKTATVRSNVRHARNKLRAQLAELKDEMS